MAWRAGYVPLNAYSESSTNYNTYGHNYNISTNQGTILFWCSFITGCTPRVSANYVAIFWEVNTRIQSRLQKCQNHHEQS